MKRFLRITIGEYTGLRRPKPWCDRKQPFKSEEAARAGVRALLKRQEERGIVQHGEVNVYQCPTCHFWHHGRRRASPVP